MQSLFFLTTNVLRSEWIQNHPAFQSTDGAVVRAYMQMLNAAVRAPVGGLLPAASDQLAALCGLSEEQVIANWEVLTNSWVLTPEGCLHHAGVANYCFAVCELFSEQISEVHRQIAELESSIQLSLDIAGDDAKPKSARKTQSKRKIPADFDLTPSLRQWLHQERGVASEYHQRYLMEKFKDFAKSKAPLYADWDAAFRNNADMLLRQGLPADMPQIQSDRVSRPAFGAGRSRPAAQQDLVRHEASNAFARAQDRAAARGTFNAQQ